MAYKILFKYPTRGRRRKFFLALNKYYSLMSKSKDFKFLITIDRDDAEMNDPFVLELLDKQENLEYHIVEPTNKIKAVNEGIFDEEFDIVVIVSDDMIPQVFNYDEVIRKDMEKFFPDTDGCLWYNDGYQANKINTLQICGNSWFRRFGYVYHEDYISLFSDEEYQNVAKGHIRYIDNVIIKHEHPNYGHGTYDKFYQLNNKNEAHDQAVFKRRSELGFPIGIPKIAHFIWSEGTPLNYLRYLTYKTFKDLHPDWRVKFHLLQNCGKKKRWRGGEKLEYQANENVKDYLPYVGELTLHDMQGIIPNYASDLIRWKVLYEDGGYYFDLDQLFCRSFDDLVDYDIVWGGDKCNYSGVIGMFKHCPCSREMNEDVKEKIKHATHYCEVGNWLWDSYVKETDLSHYKTFCTPMSYFYPIERSEFAQEYYDGKSPIKRDTYAIHWFGGHPDSQKFVKKSEQEINKVLLRWQNEADM